MKYTVKQIARIAGVSVRTLHYYDGIGLLRPAGTGENGYRFYSGRELARLQQILFFRELDFPLADIKNILENQRSNAEEILREQKRLLLIKKSRLENIIKSVDRTIKNLNNKTMKADDMFDSFSLDEMDKYKEEAKKRWGHTDAYRQSQERTKNWTKADYKKAYQDGEALGRRLAQGMDYPADSLQAQKLVEEHRRSISQYYDFSDDHYRRLGKMYVEDKRFTAYYDRFRPGLAAWLNKAIDHYCKRHKV